MDTTTIRYYMHNIPALMQEIEEIRKELEDYRHMKIDAFQVYCLANCDGSQHVRGTESVVEKIAIPRADVIKNLENQLYYKQTILKAINHVILYEPQTTMDIIERRYLNKKQGVHTPSLQQIADELNIDTTTVKYHDKRVMYKIQKEYDKNLEPIIR